MHRLQTSEKISAHIHQVRSYQPISINTTRHVPDTTRQASDTTRHHQTWSRHHQTPPHMHHVWFVWSKTSYSGDKWRCHRCGTDGRTNERTTSKDRATQLLICEPLSFAIKRKWSSKILHQNSEKNVHIANFNLTMSPSTNIV